MVWYVLHTCGRAEAVTCALSGARAIARTNAWSRWRKSKERKIPVPAPSRHAPRKRSAWRVSLLGLDLQYPVCSSPLCRAIVVGPRSGSRFSPDGRASVGPFTWKGVQSHFIIFMDLDRNWYYKPVARDLFFMFMGLGRNRYCKPVARDLFLHFYGSLQELIL